MKIRIFKENALFKDEQTVSNLNEAVAIYKRYFREGYTVRVGEVETGIEYAMCNETLAPVPYRQSRAPILSKGWRRSRFVSGDTRGVVKP